jgi:hypothetical protein
LAESNPNELPDPVVDFLRGGEICALTTLDDDGAPTCDLLSWIMALDNKTVRLTLHPQSPPYKNLLERDFAAVQIIGPDLAYCIKGKARLTKEKLESLNFTMSFFDMKVDEVRENMFHANHLTGSIPFEVIDKAVDMHADFDKGVLDEMRSTSFE